MGRDYGEQNKVLPTIWLRLQIPAEEELISYASIVLLDVCIYFIRFASPTSIAEGIVAGGDVLWNQSRGVSVT